MRQQLTVDRETVVTRSQLTTRIVFHFYDDCLIAQSCPSCRTNLVHDNA